ncbi:MAG: hypothetical protein AAGD00_05660 [Planctomycetota bacterium]
MHDETHGYYEDDAYEDEGSPEETMHGAPSPMQPSHPLDDTAYGGSPEERDRLTASLDASDAGVPDPLGMFVTDDGVTDAPGIEEEDFDGDASVHPAGEELSDSGEYPDPITSPMQDTDGLGSELVDVLDNIERQLDKVRKHRAESTKHLKEISARQQVLVQKEVDLSRQEAELDTLNQKLEERSTTLEDLEKRLVERSDEVEAQASSLDERERTLLDRAEEIEAQSKSFDEREAALESREREIADRDASIEQRLETQERHEREMDEREQSLRAQHETIERTQREADDAKQRLADQEEELASRRDALSSLEAELREKEAAMRPRLEEAERTLESLKQREEELRSREAELSTREHELHEKLEEAVENAKADRTSTVELRKRLEDRAEELGQQSSEYERKEAEITRRESAVQEERTKLIAREAELVDQLSEIKEKESALKMRERRLEDRASSIEADAKTKAGDTGALEARLVEVQSRAEEAEARRDELEKRAEDLERALAEASSRSDVTPADDSALVEREKKLDHKAEELEKLQAKMKKAAEVLKEREGELKQREAERTAQPVAADSSAPGGVPALRRERLHRQKTMLKERSEKIMRAQETLRAKAKQFEQLALERSRVQNERNDVMRLREKVEKNSAFSKASVGLAAFVFTLAVIAGASWMVTQHVAQPAFVAHAEISTDGGDGSEDADRLADWRAYLLETSLDPQLMEDAADRMRRRGMTALGNPSDLRTRLERDLDIADDGGDSVTLTLRGVGAERVERELETYALDLVAMANATRTHRADGIATAVRTNAEVDPTPIEDPRLMTFAAIAGGGGGGAAFLLLVTWRVLASRRKQIESRFEDDPESFD